ncbi:MAG: hypothetical protein ACRDH1_02290 [Actinomycetota bacterium]
MARAPKTPEEYPDRLDEPSRSELRELHDLIRRTVPEFEPYLESGMIGYGRFHYRYPTGREGNWFRIGLASRRSF